MGDPKKIRKTYKRPGHPWQRERIEEERPLVKEYALKNKRELWKVNSILRDFKYQSKKLAALQTEQSQMERLNLIKKIQKLGLIKENAQIDDVLGLTIKNLLDRRLQTLVYKKGLARTTTQARQFIVHRHILVDDKNIDVPSYIVPLADEDKISFKQKSSLYNVEHPERVIAKPVLVGKPVENKDEKKEERTHKKEEHKGNDHKNEHKDKKEETKKEVTA